MMPSGLPTPVGGSQSVSPSLRSNSGVLGGAQAGSVASQQPFSSLSSPHPQFNSNSNSNNNNNNMGLMGNISNVSSLHSHLFGNGGPDPLSFTSANQDEGIQDYQQYFLQHLQSVPNLGSVKTGPQQPQSIRSLGPVKLEHHNSDSSLHIQQQQQLQPQQLQSIRSSGPVKLEHHNSDSSLHLQQQQQLQPQQPQSIRSLGPVKLEHHNSDLSLNLQQQQQLLQQQQQQLLQISREYSQAAAAQTNLFQQQRMLRQQQLLKTMSQQRTHLQQQLQQGPPARPQGKPITHEPGMCARRLTHYMYHQQRRPEDNNIEFWRKFVAEYFAPNAKKRWCVSLYGIGRQTTGVFPQEGWHCEICNRKPGRGFETTAEVLPRLFQIKYASGTLEELLYIDMPREYQNASGQIVLDYAKAVQESVLEKLRVVREGQLRIVFSLDLKICSWEFCATARHHEELISRRLLIPQINQLGAVVQKYQNAAQNDASGLSAQDLQNACNSFLDSARQLAKALEVPLVNDLGYSKRYVRCLQISEVINSMKDLIDYSRETGTGPMESLINFPRRTSATSGFHAQRPEEQQVISQNPDHIGQNSINSTGMQLASASNGVTSLNNSLGAPSPTSRSPTTIAGPSNSLPLLQPNPSSPNNNATPTSHGGTQLNSSNSPANMSTVQEQTTQLHEADPTDSRSSVEKILQAVLMSSKLNGVSASGNEMKGVDGLAPALNGGNYSIGNGRAQDSSFAGKGFRSMGGIGSHATPIGLRMTMANRSMSMNGRVEMNHIPQDPMAMNHQQQQDMGNCMLGGNGSANSFSNLQFDWKPSPY